MPFVPRDEFKAASSYLENVLFIALTSENEDVANQRILELEFKYEEEDGWCDYLSIQEVYHIVWLVSNVERKCNITSSQICKGRVFSSIKDKALYNLRAKTYHEYYVHPILFDGFERHPQPTLTLKFSDYYDTEVDSRRDDMLIRIHNEADEDYNDDNDNENIQIINGPAQNEQDKAAIEFLENYKHFKRSFAIPPDISRFYDNPSDPAKYIRELTARSFDQHLRLFYNGFCRNIEEAIMKTIDTLRSDTPYNGEEDSIMLKTSFLKDNENETQEDDDLTKKSDYDIFIDQTNKLNDQEKKDLRNCPTFEFKEFFLLPKCDYTFENRKVFPDKDEYKNMFSELSVSLEGWLYSYLFRFSTLEIKDEDRWTTYIDQAIMMKTALSHADNFIHNINLISGRVMPEDFAGYDIKVLETDSMSLLREKTEDLIAAAIDLKRFVQDTEIKCRKCKAYAVIRTEKQTRSADEAATLIYTCSACGHKWVEN